MKYIDEFRNGTIAINLSRKIVDLAKGLDTTTLMEVCGSHTMNIYRYGLKNCFHQIYDCYQDPDALFVLRLPAI